MNAETNRISMTSTILPTPSCVALALALAFFSCSPAYADIYKFVQANGVTVFTNVSTAAGYQLVLKEKADPIPAQAPDRPAARRADWKSPYASSVHAAGRAADVDPALIHAVIRAESGYNPSARSSKGAVGLMQLMPETAKRYGVLDRLDPVENIRGGAHYLRDLLHMFNNDLRLAIAAYNAGEEAVVKYGNRIPPYPETAAYVPRVMSYYRRYRTSS
jgi:soluble lytic murein transglycosylase-like protein